MGGWIGHMLAQSSCGAMKFRIAPPVAASQTRLSPSIAHSYAAGGQPQPLTPLSHPPSEPVLANYRAGSNRSRAIRQMTRANEMPRGPRGRGDHPCEVSTAKGIKGVPRETGDVVEARTGRWSQAGFPGHRVLEIPLAATLRLPSKRSNQLAHIGTYALSGGQIVVVP